MTYEKELQLIKSTLPRLFAETEKEQAKISYKKMSEVVTSSDLFIESELIRVIKDAFPSDFFHSEEFNQYTELKNRTWIIDPIDGTSNYAHALDLFVNQVAFYDEGNIVLSVVYYPRVQKIFYAVKGEGAFMNGEKISVADSTSKNNLMSLVGISHQTEKNKDMFYQMIRFGYLNNIKIRMLGTLGYEMTAVASGSFSMLYTDVKNLWDIAPGMLLVREAGGYVVNQDGDDYQFGDEHLFCFCDKALIEKAFLFMASLEG